MNADCKSIAERYYTLVGQKNIEEIKKLLHDEVEFIGPLASLKGKDAVIGATSNFANAIKSLTIRAKFGEEDEAAIIYSVDMPGISSDFPGVSWVRFHDGLIVRIQLFYDGSKMVEKKEEIFS